MTLRLLLRLLRQNALWLVLIPAITALTAFYFTRNQPRQYLSNAVLYTGLASGYSILSEEKDTRVDHNAVNNAFDNLLSTISSRETVTQVGARLLAHHLLLERPDSLVLAAHGFSLLRQRIPERLREQLIAGRTVGQTYQRVDSMAHAVGNNPVKELLLGSSKSYYSVEQITKDLKATRKNTSDMLELAYQADDPAVTYATLDQLINVFSARYAGFKSSETNPVVSYYQTRNRSATQKLQQAETRLKSFGESNKIINYDEQSKSVAATKENLAEEYNKELMKNGAAKASMDALGKRVEDRTTVLTTNEELTDKRAELTTVSNQLANAQVYGRSAEVIGQLTAKSDRLSEELKAAALKYYKVGNTTESLPQTRLLDEWLTRVIDYEESSARLHVYEKRMREFDEMASKFAPLGSTLNQLNRDISVAEKDYLTTLQDLNQARVRQKNAEMTGPLTLLDAPEFPLQPLPSKRWMLLAAAFGVGLILALLLLLLRFWADGRIYSPTRVESLTGLPVVAAFPTARGRRLQGKHRQGIHSMFEQLRSAATIEMNPLSVNRPFVLITVWSTRKQQGKTWVARQMAERYGLSGQRVAYLHPHPLTDEIRPAGDVTSIAYDVRNDFADATRVDALLSEKIGLSSDYYDIVVLEVPSLSDHPIPTHLVAQSNVSLMVVSANSTWTRTDQNLCLLYQKAAAGPVLTVLNHVETGLIEVLSPVETLPAPARTPQQTGPVAVSITKAKLA